MNKTIYILQVPRRYIRDMQNPLQFYSDNEFRKRYRFRKQTVIEIMLPVIYDEMVKINRRGLPFPPILCLLVALRFYATGNFQIVTGDLRGFSQPTVSRCIFKISRLLAQLLPTYIKFPEGLENQRKNQRLFYAIANFPKVTGCIDCTHIPIKSPGGNMAEVYRNRKRYFSINVQVVGGPNLEIFDVVARWPGREHDSMIFNNSSVKHRFENGSLTGFLLGDSGYACLPYLMTPLLNPGIEQEVRYNRSHIRTRNTVERLFGLWKKRFCCLSRGLNNKLERVPEIIVACAVLHNIGIKVNDVNDEQDNVEEELDDNEPHIPNQAQNIGHIVRRRLIEQHFN
ncbi:putative nuclease HARBI1 [Diabrotica virgifera virgifera]|uniref:DDE Tnp4 domain-containing protein n=1 Tax=Diabrotica virgifera virgifera TaxID=50390 RepID=A0ABM5L421_DIAVI|nr:putative nuclease HARBI1 [Diabrotica virgifera virgifera]